VVASLRLSWLLVIEGKEKRHRKPGGRYGPTRNRSREGCHRYTCRPACFRHRRKTVIRRACHSGPWCQQQVVAREKNHICQQKVPPHPSIPSQRVQDGVKQVRHFPWSTTPCPQSGFAALRGRFLTRHCPRYGYLDDNAADHQAPLELPQLHR
jgi:hypothetical protein